MHEIQLGELQEKLGYVFSDKSMLVAALTHSSYANEKKQNGAASNERLEFLGDSILGMTIAMYIYSAFPDMPEGKMTKLRADLVCEKSLAALAVRFGLGEYILLGKGEENSGGRKRPSILADAVEATIAAIFLDGGYEAAARFITGHFAEQAAAMKVRVSDYKTALQEVVQEKDGRILCYHTIGESGPDHMKSFTVEVLLNGERIGEGTGKSKKEAEQLAAMSALEELAGAGG